MEKSQREYYLNEQMKAIQKELDNGESGPNEIEQLQAKVDDSGMSAEAKKKTADPKHCEVCKKVIGDLIAKVKEMPKKQQKDKNKIEKVIAKYCKDKGKKLNPKEKKVCYYLEPIKREVSTPISFGAPVDRVCKKLEKKMTKFVKSNTKSS